MKLIIDGIEYAGWQLFLAGLVCAFSLGVGIAVMQWVLG